MTMTFFKRTEIVVAMCTLVGILSFIPFFFGDTPAVIPLGTVLNGWASVLASFMVLWGAVNVLQFHGQIVYKRVDRQGRKDYIWSAYLLIAIFVTAAIGVFGGTSNVAYTFISQYIYGALSSAMFSTLVYYVYSAGYRAVRARTWEIAVILVVNIIMIIEQTPILQTFGVPLGIYDLGVWIVSNLSSATLRAVTVGIGLSTIVLMFKVFFGRERGWLGRE